MSATVTITLKDGSRELVKVSDFENVRGSEGLVTMQSITGEIISYSVYAIRKVSILEDLEE